ncbi:MAG: hypothetical protein COS95_07760 [Ignavibacteriales bacterium CG07_land_8_20_14_0_80_59_12]|nr:MAG: hypothetical protein COS95_07760 [Ignavibacteriales bacterium CG07_land_8_20_14_0_80_59_12]
MFSLSAEVSGASSVRAFKDRAHRLRRTTERGAAINDDLRHGNLQAATVIFKPHPLCLLLQRSLDIFK